MDLNRLNAGKKLIDQMRKSGISTNTPTNIKDQLDKQPNHKKSDPNNGR